MCIYIRYSMSIKEKVFHYEENKLLSLNAETIYGLGVRTLQIEKTILYSL